MKELIERLRTYESQFERELADALEQQAKRIAELERATDHAIEINNALQSELEQQAKQIEELTAAIDEQMIVTHLGVFNLGDDPKEAIHKLMCWSQGVGEFFAQDQLKELAAALAGKDEALHAAEIAYSTTLADQADKQAAAQKDAELGKYFRRECIERDDGWEFPMFITGAPSIETLDDVIDAAQKEGK